MTGGAGVEWGSVLGAYGQAIGAGGAIGALESSLAPHLPVRRGVVANPEGRESAVLNL